MRPTAQSAEKEHPLLKLAPLFSSLRFWAALALFFLSLYEIFVRLDDLAGELKMVSHLVTDGRLSWQEFLTKYMWDLHSVPQALYLLFCALLALWALLPQKRRGRTAAVLQALAAALLLALGIRVTRSLPGSLTAALRSALLSILSVLALLRAFIVPRKKRRRPPTPLRDGRPLP